MQFTDKLVIAVIGEDGQTKLYSTDPSFYGSTGEDCMGGVPYISYRRHYGSDEKLETLVLNIELVGIRPAEIRNLQVIGSFKYFLSDLLQMEMGGLINVNIDTPNGASLVYVDGDLMFQQDAPILVDSVKRTLYKDDPLSSAELKRYSLYTILENYMERTGKHLHC